MCDLYKKISDKYVFGYKVIFIDGKDRKWSPAMGFCYDDYDKVPIVENQKKLCRAFNDDILKYSKSGYNFLMLGRTSAFKKLEDAKDLLGDILETEVVECNSALLKFRGAIFRVILSGDLMDGTYNHQPIYAGRKIEFIEEVTHRDCI